MALKVKRIATWNPYVGNAERNVYNGLTEIKKEHNPEEIALQEVSEHLVTIAGWCEAHGYRLLVKYVEPRLRRTIAGREARSTCLLVRNDVQITRWTAWKMRRTWRGPKGRIKPGRTFVSVVARRLRTTAGHMPTGRRTARNRPAWRETVMRLRRQARRFRLPQVWIMDWNDDWRSNDADSIRRFAHDIGGRVVHDEAKVDYAVVRGVKQASYQSYDKMGSDVHRYGILTLVY